MTKKIFFIGIAGTGMSRLAILLKQCGYEICGSDRFYPGSKNHPQIERLEKSNIRLYPQDASGIDKSIDTVITTPAIEESNADLSAAKLLGLNIVSRSKFLAGMFNSMRGIGISGTSGKTSTAGMVSTIFKYAGKPHLFYCGDDIAGESDLSFPEPDTDTFLVTEIDESDGSPVYYHSDSLVITNVSLDHKQLNEIIANFVIFCNQCRNTVVLNADCPYYDELRNKISSKNIVTFGIKNPADFRPSNINLCADGSEFDIGFVKFRLAVPGMHNIYNALAAIALAESAGLALNQTVRGLSEFKGMKRRLELVAEKNGIRVYDDYSHNPDKIYAALTTLKQSCRRLIFIFRPHGYGPMILFKDQLIKSVKEALNCIDKVIFLDIYDAGGTADRSVHSSDFVESLKAQGVDAQYVPDPDSLGAILKPQVQPGDTIVLMGARDPYLSRTAKTIANTIFENAG